jgi:carbon-monoxide dehydrogenase iron sulfur subunit
MKRIIIHEEDCINCCACAMVCSIGHYGVCDRSKSNVRPPEEEGRLYACLQCGRKVCVETCLKKALKVDVQTGAVICDLEKCDGCGKCALGCPNHGSHVDPRTEKIMICDLCHGDPLCANVCPTNAIQYMELNDYAQQKRDRIASKMILAQQRLEVIDLAAREEPACVVVCPTGALLMGPYGVDFFEDYCIGCHKCLEACPIRSGELSDGGQIPPCHGLCGDAGIEAIRTLKKEDGQ